jgi:hypothetical protein
MRELDLNQALASSRDFNQRPIEHRPGGNATIDTVRWIISTAPEIPQLLAVALGREIAGA